MLELYSQGKEKGGAVARVTLEGLTSQPVDGEDQDPRMGKTFLNDNPGMFSKRGNSCMEKGNSGTRTIMRRQEWRVIRRLVKGERGLCTKLTMVRTGFLPQLPVTHELRYDHNSN